MMRYRVTFAPPGAPAHDLGVYEGDSLEAVRKSVRAAWPYLPEPLLAFERMSWGRGFSDPAVRARAAERLRDPDLQRAKVAKRLATEAIRRAHEAELAPEARERLRKRRAKRYEARWRRYWTEKGRRRDAE
jgi:hypothetical protein